MTHARPLYLCILEFMCHLNKSIKLSQLEPCLSLLNLSLLNSLQDCVPKYSKTSVISRKSDTVWSIFQIEGNIRQNKIWIAIVVII